MKYKQSRNLDYIINDVKKKVGRIKLRTEAEFKIEVFNAFKTYETHTVYIDHKYLLESNYKIFPDIIKSCIVGLSLINKNLEEERCYFLGIGCYADNTNYTNLKPLREL